MPIVSTPSLYTTIEWLALGVAILIIALMARRIFGSRRKEINAKWYTRNGVYPLTKMERDFYILLRHYFGDDTIILSQVPLICLAQPKARPDTEVFRRLKYKINRMRLDFVILHSTGSVECIIELDGDSHQTKAQRRLDKERDRFLTELGYDIFRYTHKNGTPLSKERVYRFLDQYFE